MQQNNPPQTASIHELPSIPSIRQPAEPPPSSQLPASEDTGAPANGTKRPSIFAPAWDRLWSAGWMKWIIGSSAARAFVSTVKKALDDTQPKPERDDKKWQ